MARKLARQALGLRQPLPKPAITEEEDKDKHLNGTQNPTPDNNVLLATLEELEEMDKIWIHTKTLSSIEFHLKHDEKKEQIQLEEQIPEEYHEFLDIFDEQKADRFPESQTWDHKIELKEGF